MGVEKLKVWKHVIEQVEFIDPNSISIKGYSFLEDTGRVVHWKHSWDKEGPSFNNQTSSFNDKLNHLSNSKLSNCLDYFIEKSNIKNKVALKSIFNECDTIKKTYYVEKDGSIISE